ncbi:hypothetical protein GGI00_002786 [Coemansia sp. RSA 2681]|nr:hypothetical protein GGI00_002786 [Coemansia sp. RSA 2681]
MDEDVAKRLHEIGMMTLVLAKYNLLVNVKKSVFAVTSRVEVLGMLRSADGTWEVPDKHIATLLDLPMPRTVSEIRRMAGGLNSTSRHMPWVQAALLPFYQKTAKVRRTAGDEPVQQCLLSVKHLYVPPTGVPLTLRVDAASAGVGAGLLAQKSKDHEDNAPQGHRHSTWRKAKVVIEAVQYFYPLLDGCNNLEIESDASAVIGLFSHKTQDDANDLSRFRAELTSLGVSKDMLVRRPGVQQEAADWLSRSWENISPRETAKPRKAQSTERDADDGRKKNRDADDKYEMYSEDDGDEDEDLVSDDDDDAEEEIEDLDKILGERPDFTPLREGGVEPGHADFMQARISTALSDLPRVGEHLEYQYMDWDIIHWEKLCWERQRRIQNSEDMMSESSEVCDMRPNRQVLEHTVLTRQVGLQARWAPMLATIKARRYTKGVHAHLGHPGYVRTLNFVREQALFEAMSTMIQGLIHTCNTCEVNATQHHVYSHLGASDLPEPRVHIYADIMEPGVCDDEARYGLVVRDACSGWTEVYPMENQT